MPTRFYLPSSGAADVSPTYDGGWEDTTNADRIKLTNKNKDNVTALTDKIITEPDTVTRDYLNRQFVSDPLGSAVSFEGTFSLVVRCVESAGSENAFFAVVVKVVSNDGATEKGTLYSTFSTGSEFSIIARTRIVNQVSITPLVSEAGDRIVVEIGFNANSPIVGGGTVTQRFGSSGSSDFALTTDLTTDLNSWCEFSTNISIRKNLTIRPRAFSPGLAR